jgi:hypothetical protein
LKQNKLTVEQEEFIKMNYQNQSKLWIANQLHVKLQIVGQKIRSLKKADYAKILRYKERDLAKKTDPIGNLRIKLIELYEQLPNLKGKEWDEQVRRINNISVDIDLKRRQKALRNSSAHFGDEQPVYHIPKN